MSHVVSATLIIVAVIHLLPLPGVLGRAPLEALYGTPLDDPNLVLLMQHRAVLFGLLGIYLLYAAFTPTHQPLALIAGFVSVLSFVALAWLNRAKNAAIKRIVMADAIALACLVLGAIALSCT